MSIWNSTGTAAQHASSSIGGCGDVEWEVDVVGCNWVDGGGGSGGGGGISLSGSVVGGGVFGDGSSL